MTQRMMRLGGAIIAAGFYLMLTAMTTLAAANPQEAADSTTGWVYRWLNFLIFVGIIAYFFWKKSPPFFRRRREEIGQAIAESTRAHEEAEQQQREAEAKFANLDVEIAKLRERSKHEIAAEIERIRALAEEEAKRIEHAGQVEIVVAEHTAQMELQSLTVRLAIERAEALLRERMTPQADSVLFVGFVAELEGSFN